MTRLNETEANLISSEDRPTLAEAGRMAPPVVGGTREALRSAVEAAVWEQLSLMGVIDTGKKASDLGKKAADALTDKGKDIEDKAIHREKDARDEAHRKMQEDKSKKGQSARSMSGASRAFSKALAEVRG